MSPAHNHGAQGAPELPAVLGAILADVERRARRRRARLPVGRLRVEPDHGRRAAFRAALAAPGLSVIAECKRASPSAGRLLDADDVLARAEAYRRAGAAALSVLTERDHFGGARAHLVRARRAGLPVLRKDFVVDADMLVESAAMGAHAVLLIARCHRAGALRALVERAQALGLAALVEIHAPHEAAAALDSGADAIGVNARDLDTLAVDVNAALELVARLPAHVLRVAESGLRGPADLTRARAAGADAVLVGTALARGGSPERALRELCAGVEVGP
jgi:indole-3-glycerol phosphate synthase